MTEPSATRKRRKRDRSQDDAPSVPSKSRDEAEAVRSQDDVAKEKEKSGRRRIESTSRKNGNDLPSESGETAGKRKRKRKEIGAPSEDTDDEEDFEMDSKSKRQAKSEALCDPEMGEWTSQQDSSLLGFVTSQLANSKIKKVDKIDWSKVSVPNQSKEKCLKRANHIAGHIRRVKTLQEVFVEASELFAKDPFAFNYRGGRFSVNKKRKRLVDEPPPPPSAYMLFSKVQMKKLQLKNPTESIAFFGKQMGEEWREMSAKKKAKYLKKASEARSKYEEEMKEFLERHPEMKGQKQRVFWPLDAPVKPRTAYFIFVEEQKDKLGADSMKEKRVKLREMYKTLSKEEKDEYTHKASEDKKRFQKELSAYYKAHPERRDVCEQVLTRKSKAEDKKPGKDAVKKKIEIPFEKPPPTVYLFYSNLRRNELKKQLQDDEMIDFSTFSKRVGKEWKAVPKEEKEKLAKKLEKKKKKYEKDLEQYLSKLPAEDRIIAQAQLVKEMRPGIPMAGFSAYSKSKRLEMKASFPDESAAKITKRLKSMWCEAGHEERLRWKSIEESVESKKKGSRGDRSAAAVAVAVASAVVEEEDEEDEEEGTSEDSSDEGKEEEDSSSSEEEDDEENSSSDDEEDDDDDEDSDSG
ncbi:nucleolar transcription factor 1-A-like [Oscarella lobularis]|uniref:nucleolar transcription factor 1-A-like n=1 Tax=Oscarella lobularis TaxID=121494 RepID=UPI003313CD26